MCRLDKLFLTFMLLQKSFYDVVSDCTIIRLTVDFVCLL